jgi:hypothetical protein
MAADVTINADYAPALVFISRDGANTDVALVDRAAPVGARDRAICRALLLHALSLLDAAEVGERLALGLPATPAA